MTVQDTIAERQKTHGDYKTQCVTAQALKLVMQQAPNWNSLEPHMRESLDLIATKISRLLHGDPQHADTWHDIAGYAQLSQP